MEMRFSVWLDGPSIEIYGDVKGNLIYFDHGFDPITCNPNETAHAAILRVFPHAFITQIK